MLGKLPNLFVPGFQKCATTTLFGSLTRHPEIGGATTWKDLDSGTRPKEVHYFDRYIDRGPEFYASLFLGTEKYALDATPNYLATFGCFNKLLETVPDPRFVVCMRDPVERALSAWNHWNQLNAVSRWPISCPGGGLRENVDVEVERHRSGHTGSGFFGMGCYGKHIETALQTVDRSQFHFLFAEWLNESFNEEINKVFRFLGLSEFEVPVAFQHRRKWEIANDPSIIEWMRELYREDCKKLENLLDHPLPWNWHNDEPIRERASVELSDPAGGEEVSSEHLCPAARSLLSLWEPCSETNVWAGDSMSQVIVLQQDESFRRLSERLDQISEMAGKRRILVIVALCRDTSENDKDLIGRVEYSLFRKELSDRWYTLRAKGSTLWFARIESVGGSQRIQRKATSSIPVSEEESESIVALWAHRRDGIKPRKLPKIFLPGFQKCGTSALHAMLIQHPRIAAAHDGKRSVKELNYFCRDYEKGRDYYQSYFRAIGRIHIDGTPNYLATRQFLIRIRDMIPDAKFVVLMRDPVSRAYSAWNYWNRHRNVFGNEWQMPIPDGTFEDNFWADVEGGEVRDGYWGLFSCGLYINQLQNLFELFGKEAVYLSFAEELRNDHQRIMSEVFEFLGIRECKIPFLERNVSPYQVPSLSKQTESKMVSIYKDSVLRLEKELGIQPPWGRWFS
ncbi:MAG: sulfotransferase domain-containing protein [Verrucomicrobiales bacterium]|nr:sulfotransferase domain-containing protein [Verrucomicrobiales bacterium]